MFMILTYVLAVCLAQLATATASDQFKLQLVEQASQCFLDCHAQVIENVNLTGQEGNSVYAYGRNCVLPGWQDLMSQCIVLACESPPDVAYAIEYATSICSRAGKDVTLQLPEEYLDTVDGAYFSSELYMTTTESTSGDARAVSIKAGVIGTAVAVGAIGAALI